MLNRVKHQLIMGRVLRDIYADAQIASLLGFKGGTCAYFFYALPRFSVDLDFEVLKKILEQHGEIKDKQIKRNTIFFLLSYDDADHNIKVEVNTRADIPAIGDHFEVKEHLGISVLVGTQPYLFAGKLAALSLRSETAMRDIYDVWYFAKSNWDIDVDVLKIRTGKSPQEQFAACIAIVKKVKDNQILQGLGELLNEKDKAWVKNHLRKETIFLLKNYQSVLKHSV
jgi:predicted nucleotidyltransferase component of viral defense system